MNKQLRRNLVFNTAGSLVFYICQAAMNLLVTAMIGTEANGMLATAMTIANVALSFSSFGMRTFQVSDHHQKYTDRTYLLSRYVTIAVAWVGCMVFAFANSYSPLQRSVIFLYTGYRLLESFSDVWHAYLQRDERMDIVGISFGVRGFLTAGSIVAGIWFTGDLVDTLILLLALNVLYILVVDLPLASKRANLATKGDFKRVWPLLLECAPLAIYASLNTTIASTPRYYCERILGADALSYFANLFLPVLLLQVAATYLFVPFITTFSRLWAEKNKAAFLKGLRILAVCLLALWGVGAAGVAIFGRFGLSLLYPSTPEILQYVNLLQPLVICCCVTVLVTVLCNLLTIARAMPQLIIGNLAGLAAAYLISPPLIEAFGLWGTAWATLASIGVQAAFLLVFLLAKAKRHFAEAA